MPGCALTPALRGSALRWIRPSVPLARVARTIPYSDYPHPFFRLPIPLFRILRRLFPARVAARLVAFGAAYIMRLLQQPRRDSGVLVVAARRHRPHRHRPVSTSASTPVSTPVSTLRVLRVPHGDPGVTGADQCAAEGPREYRGSAQSTSSSTDPNTYTTPYAAQYAVSTRRTPGWAHPLRSTVRLLAQVPREYPVSTHTTPLVPSASSRRYPV